MFADEPTGSLDHATGARIIDLLFKLNAESGATLVLVTHDPSLAARCGRILALANGRLVSDRATEQAESAESVESAETAERAASAESATSATSVDELRQRPGV